MEPRQQRQKKKYKTPEEIDPIDSNDVYAYKRFLMTLPKNLQNSPDYRMYAFWKYNGKPVSFPQGVEREMFSLESDGWHAMSVAHNPETSIDEFMKLPNNPTIGLELDWFYGDTDDAREYRKTHTLNKDGDFQIYEYNNYMEYIIKKGDTISSIAKKIYLICSI